MGRSRYEEIAEALRQAIRSGAHPLGSRLPSESDLAARWGASRGTVRQAVALLVSEGLIGSRQGPGGWCCARNGGRASSS